MLQRKRDPTEGLKGHLFWLVSFGEDLTEYLSIWTGILFKRDRREMPKETGYMVPLPE